MGVLDRVMSVEEEKKTRVIFSPVNEKKSIDTEPTKIRCDRCAREFDGQKWMMHSRKEMLCTHCDQNREAI